MKNKKIVLDDKILNFIIQERGKYNFELSEQHSLQEDLNIYGIDAVEFIINFGHEFNVDVTNFDAEKYFKGDGFSFTKKIYKRLTIGHLIDAIHVGKLV